MSFARKKIDCIILEKDQQHILGPANVNNFSSGQNNIYTKKKKEDFFDKILETIESVCGRYGASR